MIKRDYYLSKKYTYIKCVCLSIISHHYLPTEDVLTSMPKHTGSLRILVLFEERKIIKT